MESARSSWDRLSPDEDTAPLRAFDGPGLVDIRFRVGRYVVLEEIGRGGMGRVLRAYDPKLQREVALKEVRRETLGRSGAQRLVAEARAMAKLSHPNVVAVYDVVEIEDGQVVLVMQYVAGQSLTAWLRTTRGWRDVLAQLRRAGRGLAAAHAAGLLHRDFKPDNVMVGADGHVRVTDFGLARDILPEDTGEHAELDPEAVPPGVELGLTAPGSIVGTLPYLSPERLVGAPADAATDQFAYCVALWEALFGERPFVGQSIVELAFAMAAGRPRPPANARRVPAWLVDTLVRGLANDPRERWPGMPALLTALARDPSQRRRRWLQTAAGIGVLGVGATAVLAWTEARAQRCTEAAAIAHLEGAWDSDRRIAVHDAVLGIGAGYATEVWMRTEQLLDGYAAAWTDMHVETCEATTIRGEQSTDVMDLRMACLHRATVELSAVTQTLARADAKTVQKAHELLASLRPLERCADVEALQADVEPPLPDEAEAVDALRAELALARAALKAGHHHDARRALDAASTKLAEVSYAPVQAELAIAQGVARKYFGDYAAAETALRDGLGLAARARQPSAMQEAASELLYVVGYRQQRFDAAMGYLDVARGLAVPDHDREARVGNHLAVVLNAQGKYVEAEAEQRRALALLEEALGPDHPDVAGAQNNLAVVLSSQGKYEQAEAEYRRTLVQWANALGPDHPNVAICRTNLAVTLEAQGKYDEAETEYGRALAGLERALGPEHPDVATIRHNLANAHFSQGKHAEAEAEHRRALVLREQLLGSEHVDVAMSRISLAVVLNAQGKHGLAEAEQRRALVPLEKALGPDHADVAAARHGLAIALHEQEKRAEAEAEYRRALAIWERALGPDNPRIAATCHNLAAVLREQGKHAEAKPHQRRALTLWEQTLSPDHPNIAAARAGLAEAPP
jgi:eukaryotic-like serine/threonine-protein kinase